MPGVTIRKFLVNCRRCGCRTALTVCQAISMAITVVLPAPVAIFSARRNSSGLACSLAPAMWRRMTSYSRRRLVPADIRPATSVSHITVSAASTWQKKGRYPANWWLRQCCSSRAVSGDTPQLPGLGICRQASTCLRISLIIGEGSYSCPSSVGMAMPSCIARCWLLLRGGGTGTTCLASRRCSAIRSVGMPSPPSSQCRAGYS